jgi:adenosylmethionine---8-amino-7-oxononanoate aminotransferase
MTDFIVVGTDTDAGKTTFCLQWLTAFGDQFAYWKPIESGPSDTETIRRLLPRTTIFPPLAQFRDAVAPELAAERERRRLPGVEEILASVPDSPRPLIIETFGGPLSPLAENSLQASLIAELSLPIVLIASSKVGAVARSLQAISGLREFGSIPAAVVIMGDDDYAIRSIERFTGLPVVALHETVVWSEDGVREASAINRSSLSRLFQFLSNAEAGIRPVRDSATNLVRRDRAAIWHPYTPLGEPDDPLPVIGASGDYLKLADGRQLIDGISSWWTILHGHRHPPLMAVLRQATERFDHVLFAGVTHPPAVELAELLLSTAPWQGGRVFFSDNGSTAVEVALKMAYQAWCHRGEPERTLFIGFENGYHGDTFGAMAVGRDPVFFSRFDPLLFRTVRVPVSAERLAEALREHRGKVAAVVLEPLVQGAGGMRMHSPAELRAIAELAREHGVFYIADEVMTGGGRTGSLWAFQQAGIAPDLICAAKTLTGGIMPLAATMASPEIVAEFETPDRAKMFFHGHSFTAHPLACAVAAANWRLLIQGVWRKPVAGIEAFWRSAISPLAGRPGVKAVRIRGTIAAIEIDAPGGYLADVGRRMRQICIDSGVFLRPLGNVLYAMPPLCTSEDSLARIASAMEKCVSAVAVG